MTTASTLRTRGPWRLETTATLTFTAPLHVGTGQRLSAATDAPVLRKPDGTIWLPGSSLRGVLRDWCEREAALVTADLGAAQRVFGFAGDAGKPDRQGRLTVCDAIVTSPDADAEVRDRVRISQKLGAAAEGGKFDQEIGRPASATVQIVYEGPGPSDPEGEADLALLKGGFDALERGLLRLGGKSGSGLGACRATCEHAVEDRSADEGLSGFLARRLGDRAAAGGCVKWPAASRRPRRRQEKPWSWLILNLDLQCDGPMLTAGVDLGPLTGDNGAIRPEALADATYVVGPDGRPVLPGSSWRGVLRHHAFRIARTLGVDKVADVCFGFAHGDRDGARSLLCVGEGCYVGDPVSTVVMNHVAIDRVTGFAAEGKLFSTVALASPKFQGQLMVRWHDDDPTHKAAVALLLFVLRDASHEKGLLWVGSRTTRGYGHLKELTIASAEWSVVTDTAEGPERRENRAERPTVAALGGRLPQLVSAWNDIRAGGGQ